ncbi:MAG: 1-deoxy-D-xylulose-5-phosphate synthase [Flavobacteriaceae bacterium]
MKIQNSLIEITESYLCVMLLDTILSPKDLKTLSDEALEQLCAELRQRIINVVAKNEGHLGASLGTIELTVMLHTIFDSPNDQMIWDVGHQAYGHKILTGRNAQFESNRQWGGISGFPARSESPHDRFGTGHAGTSIGAALGMALAAQLQGDQQTKYIAIIGDASIVSGMAFEALNHLGTTQANVLVVLNDNAIGIDPSVGALKNYFEKIKTETQPNTNLFQTLNIPYSGPIDGHDLKLLRTTLTGLAQKNGPQLLHIKTTKGKGFPSAENDQVRFHAPGKFDPTTGKINKTPDVNLTKYQDVFGKTLTQLAVQNQKIVAITPAMVSGSGLTPFFEKFPQRSFDVGIAEQHALTLAAGMATQGIIPFCVLYSTFLQRAYDQLIHDIALQQLPVVLCIDRAGLVGHDGPTHHGVFDIPFLKTIPNLVFAAPKDEVALRNLLYTAQLGISKPLAIRYPRGYGKQNDWERPFEKVAFGKGTLLKKGKDVLIISVGSTAQAVETALDQIDHLDVAHADLGFIKPLDTPFLETLFRQFKIIITVEDGAISGGAGESILAFAHQSGYTGTLDTIGIEDAFVPHGRLEKIHEIAGVSPERIVSKIHELLA